MAKTVFDYPLHPRRVALILGCLALYLVIQSLIAEYLIENVLNATPYANVIQIVDLFSVNAEQTIPTVFSAALLFGAALLLAHIAIAERANHQPDARYWIGLALVFLYLAIDEGAAIHEIASDVIQDRFQTTGYLTFGWQAVAAPLVGLFAAFYLRFWLRLPSRTRLLMVLAAGLYVGGAFLGDAISANYWDANGGVSFPYLVIGSIEELCEMLGVIVLIYTLLSYAAERHYSISLIPTTQSVTGHPLFSHIVSGLLILVIGVNVALIAWSLAQPRTIDSPAQLPQTPLQTLIEQFPTEDVLMVRLIGRFDGSSTDSHRIVGSLFEVYDEVLVITLPSENSSLVFAAETLPLTREQASDILRANGVIQFVIFDTPAVRMLVQAAQQN